MNMTRNKRDPKKVALAQAIIDAYNLPPTVKANTIKSVMQDAGEDKIEMMVLSCIKAECGLDALNFVEGLK